MIFLIIVVGWQEVGIEGAITSLEEVFVQLSILKDEFAGIVDRVRHHRLMGGPQLAAIGIIDILRLVTIGKSDALGIPQHIILDVADALVQVLRQRTIGIIEVLRSLVGSVLEVEGAIVKQAASLVADRLYLVAIVLIRQVVNETKGVIVSLAISLQLLNGTIRGIR